MGHTSWLCRVDPDDKYMRGMQTRFVYGVGTTPEESLNLAEREHGTLRTGPPPAKHGPVAGIVLCAVRPRVWRRVRVTGKPPTGRAAG